MNLVFWRLRISFQWYVVCLWSKIRLSWAAKALRYVWHRRRLQFVQCAGTSSHTCAWLYFEFFCPPPSPTTHPLRLRCFLFCRAGGTVRCRSCAFRLNYDVLFRNIYIHFELRQRKKIKTVVYACHFRVQIVEHTLVLKHYLKLYVFVWITNDSHTSKVTTYLSFLNCSNANERKVQISLIQKKVSEANSSDSSGFETLCVCVCVCVHNSPTTITLLSLLDMLNTCSPLAI